MENNKLLGALGEDISCKYLSNSGYKVIERNFRCRAGEIDIIAIQDDTVVFIEVKTRSGGNYGSPSEAVSKSKQMKIIKTALFYMQKKKLLDNMCRFDVMEIIIDEDHNYNINLIKNAFQYSGRYGY